MSLTVATNMSSLIVQKNLNSATNILNSSIERMTTGYKINHAKDNAAGYSIAEDWKTKLGSIDIALGNASMGLDLLQTAEENYSLIATHLQRIRDLTEQAANGTYGSNSLDAIREEITARVEEISRIVANAEYNGIGLMENGHADILLQVGISSENSTITLDGALFGNTTLKTITSYTEATDAKFIEACSSSSTAAQKLTNIDNAISAIATRVTKIGAAQNRVESAIEALNTQSQNITSSLSTLRDTDVAQESSDYIKAQILQQASATLLSTANQAPSIALNLL